MMHTIILKPVKQHVGVHFSYGFCVLDRYLYIIFDLQEGFIGPPDAWQIDPGKIAEVMCINVAVGGISLGLIS